MSRRVAAPRGIIAAGVGVVTLVRARTWSFTGLIGLSACRVVGVEAVEAVETVEPSAVVANEPSVANEPTELDVYIEPTSIIESEPEAESEATPEPELAPEPATTPTPKSTTTGWQLIAEPQFVQDEQITGTANTASYALETKPEVPGAGLRYQLDLAVRDESTTLRLTEQDTGHALTHDWSTSLCSYDFSEGWGAGAALAELAHDQRGRQLLELWVSCRYGEDIVSFESIMLIVLVDAAGLSLVWSGGTWGHGSHVCSEWSELEVGLEGKELVIRESEVGAIFEPDEIPGYDCDESSREYRNLLGQQRVKLP